MSGALDALLDTPILLVAGTDTGVGKTAVSAALARQKAERGRDAAALKLVATGARREGSALLGDDADALWDASTPAGRAFLAEHGLARGHALATFTQPMAPNSAARLDGASLSFGAVQRRARTLVRRAGSRGLDFVLEGIGGVCVPIGRDRDIRDLAASLELPVVIVARTMLGTINHTLLTLEALAGHDVRGIVFSRQRGGPFDPVEESSIAEIRAATRRTPLFLADFSPAGTPRIAPLERPRSSS